MNNNISVFFDSENQLSFIMMNNNVTTPQIFVVVIITIFIYEKLLINSNFILTSLNKKECYYNV